MEEVNLTKYKKQEIGGIMGANPDYLDKILVTSSWGQDAKNKAKEILKKSYKSMSELSSDLTQLKSDVQAYLLFD